MHFGLTVVRVPEEDHERDGLSSYVGRWKGACQKSSAHYPPIQPFSSYWVGVSR